MFKWLAKRRLRKWGYVHLEKYRLWYNHEFKMVVTDKWINQFPFIVKEFCKPFWRPEGHWNWENTSTDTRFSPELAKEIEEYYCAKYLNKPELTVVPLKREA